MLKHSNCTRQCGEGQKVDVLMVPTLTLSHQYINIILPFLGDANLTLRLVETTVIIFKLTCRVKE